MQASRMAYSMMFWPPKDDTNMTPVQLPTEGYAAIFERNRTSWPRPAAGSIDIIKSRTHFLPRYIYSARATDTCRPFFSCS